MRAGGGVLGTAQRVLLVGQTSGGGLRGKDCSWVWLRCRGGPAFWRSEREAWNTFSKPAEAGLCKEGLGTGWEGCMRADEGRDEGGR